MYLHLGGEVVVSSKDLVGIFDLDTAGASEITKQYLKKCEKEMMITSITDELPKSAVIVESDFGMRVYLSQISSVTLKGRIYKHPK